jgi:hypothetical protein
MEAGQDRPVAIAEMQIADFYDIRQGDSVCSLEKRHCRANFTNRFQEGNTACKWHAAESLDFHKLTTGSPKMFPISGNQLNDDSVS